MLHMLASPPLNWWINMTQCSSSPICSDTQQPHDTSSDLLWFHRPVYKNWNSRTSNEPSAPKNRLQPGNLNNYIFPDKTKLQLSYLLHAHTHTHTRLLFLSRTFFSSNFFFPLHNYSKAECLSRNRRKVCEICGEHKEVKLAALRTGSENKIKLSGLYLRFTILYFF